MQHCQFSDVLLSNQMLNLIKIHEIMEMSALLEYASKFMAYLPSPDFSRCRKLFRPGEIFFIYRTTTEARQAFDCHTAQNENMPVNHKLFDSTE